MVKYQAFSKADNNNNENVPRSGNADVNVRNETNKTKTWTCFYWLRLAEKRL